MANVFCIYETKLDHDFNHGLNYSICKSPPPDSDRAKGGIAIINSKQREHNQLDLNTTLQAVAIPF